MYPFPSMTHYVVSVKIIIKYKVSACNKTVRNLI